MYNIIACLIIPVIPVRLHKAASPFIYTPLTVRAYSYHPPQQANAKAAHIDC